VDSRLDVILIYPKVVYRLDLPYKMKERPLKIKMADRTRLDYRGDLVVSLVKV